ncbi:MAG: Gfo/Idh/MocA family oxidoreductase [Planctomycetia bacterium]|nr:Gfo/Idh/MocA family oxidoreductase [Planctomycetia bacterium]
MKSKQSRRSFIKTGAALAALGTTGILRVHAGESSLLKIGLVGCGGRGCGAVVDSFTIDPNTKLVAAADIFEDRGNAGIEGLKNVLGDRIAINKDNLFIGFDGYKKVLESDIDVVILATPQHFRPETIRAAIAAGKHVFAEKPVAVDGAGLKIILEAAKMAKEKKLNLVSGLVNRYYSSTQETVKRIHEGAIGDIRSAVANRMGGGLWKRPRVEGDTEMKYQMRNWVNFNWIASEYINDVTIHQIDVALWCMGDPTPLSAIGMGGRLGRREIDTGDMYDAMAVTYDLGDGKVLQANSRQIPGCWPDAQSYLNGTKGYAIIRNSGFYCEIFGSHPFTAEKSPIPGKQFEHKVLLDAVRSGGATYVNNASYMINSTGTCLLGKLAAYTGKKVTWQEMLDYTEAKPASYDWDAVPPTLPDERGQYKIAVPLKGWEYI